MMTDCPLFSAPVLSDRARIRRRVLDLCIVAIFVGGLGVLGWEVVYAQAPW